MKNVDELYEKYCDAYKDNYDTNEKLNEAEKKQIGYKQYKLGDKKVKSQNWLHCPNGWALKMILIK